MQSQVKAVGLGMLLVLGISAITSAQASLIPPKHPPMIVAECGVPVRAYMMTEQGLYTYSGSAAIEVSRTVSPELWINTLCANK